MTAPVNARPDGTAIATVAHPGLAPSAWVQRWSHLVAPGGSVLDVACGSGRHLRWFAERGCRVTGIDRDAAAMAASAANAPNARNASNASHVGSAPNARYALDAPNAGVADGTPHPAKSEKPEKPVTGTAAELIVADIESGPWPLPSREFDAVIVTNYLWRPRLPDIVASVAPGGVLIYETFAVGHEAIGKPSNPDFLLRSGELIATVQGHPHRLCIVAFEEGFERVPMRIVQRIVAVREGTGARPTTPPALTPLGT